MFESKETRWFNQSRNEKITQWFKEHDLTHDTTKPRIDFYLPLPNKKDIGIKLREGKVEIKQRKNSPELVSLTENAEGFLEEWVKWSFNINEYDKLNNAIVNKNAYDWIKIYKERIGIKLSASKKGNVAIESIEKQIPFGCQIEYTRILLKGHEWFTFGLEWFGDDHLKLENEFLLDILGNTTMNKKRSMGYVEFLNLEFL